MIVNWIVSIVMERVNREPKVTKCVHHVSSCIHRIMNMNNHVTSVSILMNRVTNHEGYHGYCELIVRNMKLSWKIDRGDHALSCQIVKPSTNHRKTIVKSFFFMITGGLWSNQNPSILLLFFNRACLDWAIRKLVC